MSAKRYFTLLLLMTVTVCAWSQTVIDSVKINLETSAGAKIGLDGKLSSTNIMSIKVPVGKHKVTVNYGDSFRKEYDIDVQVWSQTAFKFPIIGKVNITSEPNGASVYVDGSYRGEAPLSLELLIGKHKVTVKKDPKEWYDEEKEVDVSLISESNLNFTMKKVPPREYIKNSHFYMEGNYQLLSFSGYGAAIGGYINRFNMELGFMMGSKEKAVYWYDKTYTKEAKVGYKANRLHIKTGYAIKANSRILLTPQIGIGKIYISGDGKSGKQDVIRNISDTNAMLLLASLRMTYAVFPAMQLVITPEYTTTIKKEALFDELSATSEDIKGWGTGLSIKAGLSIYF